MSESRRRRRISPSFVVIWLLVILATYASFRAWQSWYLGEWEPRVTHVVRHYDFHVVDEDGNPVKAFQTLISTAAEPSAAWAAGKNGMVRLDDRFTHDAPIAVLTRAAGFAPSIESFTGAGIEKLRRGEAQVILRRGQQVAVHLRVPDGMSWPEGVRPDVYFQEFRRDTQILWNPENRKHYPAERFPETNIADTRLDSTNSFVLRLAEDTPPFYISVNLPGVLHCFEAGPFTPADVQQGTLDIEIPRPASLKLRLEGADAATTSSFGDAMFDVYRTIAGGRLVSVARETRPLESEIVLPNLAPGEYRVEVRATTTAGTQKADKKLAGDGMFGDHRLITLSDGQTERVDFQAIPRTSDPFRGNRDAVLRIAKADGSPAAGRHARIDFYDGHYAAARVFAGRVPAPGEILLKQITDRRPDDLPFGPYTVFVDGTRLGTFAFQHSEGTENFEFHLVPRVGDMAPDIDLLDTASGQQIKLSDLRGKVVLVEFWATWCGPCQGSMQKLRELVAERSTSWGDQATVIAVSIDDDPESPLNHARQRGWDNVRHFWSGHDQDVGWESPAARALAVSGVPEAVLINRRGCIIWRGHPMDKLPSRMEYALH
jgi:thiol-disulfide isomerase/thioredoxin